jgi:hypothetical protein
LRCCAESSRASRARASADLRGGGVHVGLLQVRIDANSGAPAAT